MKGKLIHPLWTHLPAVAALIFLVVYIIIMPLTRPVSRFTSVSTGSEWLRCHG